MVAASICSPSVAASHAIGGAAWPSRRSRVLPAPAAAPAARPCRRPVLVMAFKEEVPVTFQVKLPSKAGPGQRVRVVGEPRVLAEWDAGRAPVLELVPTAASEGGGMWSGTVEGIRVGVPFQFKFVLVPDADKSPADSSAFEWEQIDNRTFQPGGAQTITAVFNKAGFEAGPAAPGTGGRSGAGWQSSRGGVDAEIKGRLEATLHRLSAEGRASRASR